MFYINIKYNFSVLKFFAFCLYNMFRKNQKEKRMLEECQNA